MMNFTMNNNFALTQVAMTQWNNTEIKGQEDNKEVVKYFKDIGFDINNDETPWCSAFMNWCAKQAGLEQTYKLNARSWLNVGTPINEDELQMGDVVVLWRESRNSWKGHVGLLMRKTDKHLYLLGGNQNNRVKISKYGKYRVLGYRRLNEEVVV